MPPRLTEHPAWITARLLYTDVTVRDLAAEYGVGPRQIDRAYAVYATAEQRRRAAAEKMSRTRLARMSTYRQPTSRFAWEGVDWRQNDPAIARVLGCSIAAVQKRRAKLGKPASPVKRLHAWTVERLGVDPAERLKLEKDIARRILRTSATCESVATRMGLSTGTVWKIYARHTTREQRREVRRNKIAASKQKSLSGCPLTLRTKMVRRETLTAMRDAVEAKPALPTRTGRQRAAAFVAGLDAA